jgi:tryptophanyl-tRNA synthetase
LSKFREDYAKGSIRYGDMKKELAEDMIAFISPIREKATSIYGDLPLLKKIMKRGAEQARERAGETIREARSFIGLDYLK